VVLDEVEGKGHQIVSSAIVATAVVEGIEDDAFQDAARVADDECPLATVIRGTGEVTVKARLEPSTRHG
jgi:organic hydroperoxide reductase OsmC/OhrA